MLLRSYSELTRSMPDGEFNGGNKSRQQPLAAAGVGVAAARRLLTHPGRQWFAIITVPDVRRLCLAHQQAVFCAVATMHIIR